jgi:hypothetical protein
MPGVMDIKHILCHPCDPYPTKNSSIDYKRRRANSETTFKEYNRQLGIIPRRKSSISTQNQLRVAWTPSEDDLLQQGYAQGLSWGMIASTYLPHRSRGCCWGRFKMLQSKHMITAPSQRFLGRPWKMNH